jgi:hypothetical protein
MDPADVNASMCRCADSSGPTMDNNTLRVVQWSTKSLPQAVHSAVCCQLALLPMPVHMEDLDLEFQRPTAIQIIGMHDC